MNVCNTTYIAFLVCVLSVSVGCKNVEQVTTQSESKSSSRLFHVTAPPLEVLANEKTTAQLSLKAVSPWKINAEYPTKLQLENAATETHFSTEKLSFGGSDIAVKASKATVSIPLRGESPGESTLKGTLKFSLCRADQCILRESSVAWNIRVSDPAR